MNLSSSSKFVTLIFRVLKNLLIKMIRFLASSVLLPSVQFTAPPPLNMVESSALSHPSNFETCPSVSSYPPLTLHSPLKHVHFADTQLGDSPPGCGRVQHCSVAQKPREEPQHGRSASRSRPGFPGYDRGREQQLHQRRAC